IQNGRQNQATDDRAPNGFQRIFHRFLLDGLGWARNDGGILTRRVAENPVAAPRQNCLARHAPVPSRRTHPTPKSGEGLRPAPPVDDMLLKTFSPPAFFSPTHWSLHHARLHSFQLASAALSRKRA